MRKIKFKAYLKRNKQMVDVKSIHFGTRKIIVGYSKSKTDYGNYSVSFDDIELMQYTGLKDKNEVEIYEDDIVKINLHDTTYLTTKIKWEQRISSFIVKDVCLLDEDAIKRLVVIGNIWENGDLLNDSK